MKGDLLEQFIDKQTISALDTLLQADDIEIITDKAVALSNIFGTSESIFKTIANSTANIQENAENKLISSFHNNLLLLIQKTWIEKFDEELKAQVLYQLEEFTTAIKQKSYSKAYTLFFTILDNMVYLMFGAQAKSKDFDEYALRIDPEFGIFWWYISSLPRDTEWSEAKIRLSLLLGMYFLANY